MVFSGGLSLTGEQCSLKKKKSKFLRGCSVTFYLIVFREGMITFVSILILNDNYLERHPYITYLVFQLYLGTCARALLFSGRALLINLFDVFI